MKLCAAAAAAAEVLAATVVKVPQLLPEMDMPSFAKWWVFDLPASVSSVCRRP